MQMFKAAYAYRHFILSSIKSDVQGKYSRSKLGLIWMILHPLAHAAVLALVLSQLIGARLSGIDSEYAYAVYLLSGILAWNLFAETTTAAISMFRDRATLLKKINFPRVCIPLIVAGTALLNHIIFFIVVITIVWLLGVPPTASLIIVPLAFVLLIAMAMGIGLILSIFDVFNRDISQFWAIVIQFWFWLTPIVYSPDILPAKVKELLLYNPVYPMISAYQHAIAFGGVVAYGPLLKAAAIAILLLSFSFFLFLRSSTDVVDEL